MSTQFHHHRCLEFSMGGLAGREERMTHQHDDHGQIWLKVVVWSLYRKINQDEALVAERGGGSVESMYLSSHTNVDNVQ